VLWDLDFFQQDYLVEYLFFYMCKYVWVLANFIFTYINMYIFIVIVQNRLGRLTPFKHRLNGLNAKQRVTTVYRLAFRKTLHSARQNFTSKASPVSLPPLDPIKGQAGDSTKGEGKEKTSHHPTVEDQHLKQSPLYSYFFSPRPGIAPSLTTCNPYTST
jgi:hypothetical protein